MKNKEVLFGLKWFFSLNSVLVLWFPFFILNMMFYSTKAGEKVLEKGDKIVTHDFLPFIMILIMVMYVIIIFCYRSQEKYYENIALRRMSEDKKEDESIR